MPLPSSVSHGLRPEGLGLVHVSVSFAPVPEVVQLLETGVIGLLQLILGGLPLLMVQVAVAAAFPLEVVNVMGFLDDVSVAHPVVWLP